VGGGGGPAGQGPQPNLARGVDGTDGGRREDRRGRKALLGRQRVQLGEPGRAGGRGAMPVEEGPMAVGEGSTCEAATTAAMEKTWATGSAPLLLRSREYGSAGGE
jgi:hypothetical protein